MAQVLLAGGCSAAVSGSINDITFYSTRWGHITRYRAIPANTSTPERTAVRSLFSSIISLWNSLTPDMQADWTELAHEQARINQVGNYYVIDGKSLFTEWNMNLGIISQPPIIAARSAAPIDHIYILKPGESTAIKLHIDIKGYENTINLPPDQYCVISSSIGRSAHARTPAQHYRIISNLVPGASLSQDVIAPYQAAWPGAGPSAGSRLFYKAKFVNGITGNACASAFASVLIT